ncbi:hypothetical protein C7K25_10420 [Gulosibacter molinativorax]|uniref:Uncharacterized protein n=1 Tax=Gulosibacter molinativorax TaxID=256821 RepID=A0ABT7CAV6_9MICO|nr:hypothetical protein [Gulosibacter molinativorax]QUY60854.1 Hypotetical protein [Gulosibacter molinativorax]
MEDRLATLKTIQLILIWVAVIAIAILGMVGLWFNPTNLFCTLLMWPVVLWAAIAPSGSEPR